MEQGPAGRHRAGHRRDPGPVGIDVEQRADAAADADVVELAGQMAAGHVVQAAVLDRGVVQGQPDRDGVG